MFNLINLCNPALTFNHPYILLEKTLPSPSHHNSSSRSFLKLRISQDLLDLVILPFDLTYDWHYHWPVSGPMARHDGSSFTTNQIN